jgi:hypothetical protein
MAWFSRKKEPPPLAAQWQWMPGEFEFSQVMQEVHRATFIEPGFERQMFLKNAEDSLVGIGKVVVPWLLPYVQRTDWISSDLTPHRYGKGELHQMRVAANVLGRMGDQGVLEPLCAALKASSCLASVVEYREAILNAIICLDRQKGSDLLVAELTDPSIKTPALSREAILNAIVCLDQKGSDLLVAALTDPSIETFARAVALNILVQSGDKRAIPLLLEGFRKWPNKESAENLLKFGWKPESPDDELYVALALGDWERVRRFGERARERLKRMPDSAEAMQLLAELGGDDSIAFFTSILEGYKDHPNSPRMNQAIDLLGNLHELRAADALIRVLEHQREDGSDTYHTRAALAKLGDPRCVRLVIGRGVYKPKDAEILMELVNKTASQLDNDLLRELAIFKDPLEVLEFLGETEFAGYKMKYGAPIDCSVIRTSAKSELARRGLD